MARYGVLGDIHGNLEALQSVLQALDARGVRELLCVGDVVGYNADPDACVALLRQRRVQVIAGNHDLIGTRRLGFERCSNMAWHALKRTRRVLSPATIAWLESLPPNRLVGGDVVLVHGGARDVQLYMTTPQHIAQNAALLRTDFPAARVCFFGHSHRQKVYEVHGDEVREQPLEAVCALAPDRLYFINAGSVDAQRKWSQRLAECAVFDSDARTVEFLRLRYDAAATEAKAAVAGYRLTPLLDRLYTLQRYTRSNFRRLTRSMFIPSMRMSWVGPRRRGECRSPSL
jgi:predicted phosphodiesterase